MENYAIYTHQADTALISGLLKKHLPEAWVDYQQIEPLVERYVATIKGGFFSRSKTLTINVESRPEPGYEIREVTDSFTRNLVGMSNYAGSLPAERPAVQQQLVIKIGGVNTQLACLAEPELTGEMEAFLRALTKALNAFVFAGPGQKLSASTTQHFLDENWELILDTSGSCAVDALVVRVDAAYKDDPIAAKATPEQEERKARSIAELQQVGVPTLASLPVVKAEADITLRAADSAFIRTYALLLCAAKASGLPQEQVDAAIAGRQLTGFSPNEIAFLDAANPEQETANSFTWRYESTNLLAWALGIVEELPPANEMVNTDALIPLLMNLHPTEAKAAATLRPATEIIDELDRTYRMHWACVNARVMGKEAPAALHPGIVYERYYALRWLMRTGDADWDAVGGYLHT